MNSKIIGLLSILTGLVTSPMLIAMEDPQKIDATDAKHEPVTATAKPTTSCWRSCFGCCSRRLRRAQPAVERAATTMLHIGEATLTRQVVEQLIGELNDLVPGIITAIAAIVHLPAPTPIQIESCTTAFVGVISANLKQNLEDAKVVLEPAKVAEKLAPDLIEILKVVIVPNEEARQDKRQHYNDKQAVTYKIRSIDEIISAARALKKDS